MRVTLVQNSPKLNRSNLKEIVNIVKDYKAKSDVIVFPELALNGYMLQDKLSEDAWCIDELDELKELSADVDIVVGGAIKNNKAYNNSALYFSKAKLLSQHKKVHLPNYGMFEEARYFDAGDVFESFVTSYGRVAMLVCEDLWHSDVHHQLSLQDIDYIFVVVASPARGFEENGLLIQEQWNILLKSVALQCNAKVVFVNRVGFEDGLGFWGGSCIVDKDTKILHQFKLFDETIKSIEVN